MSGVYVTCLLLLLSVGQVQGVEDLVDNEGDDLVRSEIDMTLEDGRKVHETSTTDKQCHVQLMTARFDDNTKNVVVNDLDDDTSLVLFSNSPGVCYVRNLDRTNETCSEGYETTNGTEDSDSGIVTHYADGKELDINDLPDTLQELCANRTIIQLVEKPVDDAENKEDSIRSELEEMLKEEEAGAIRKKRSWRWKTVCGYYNEKVCVTKRTCKPCCRGFLFWRRCSKTCCTSHCVCEYKYVRRCKRRYVFVG